MNNDINNLYPNLIQDFITQFGVFDEHEDATDGEGKTYWEQWDGNKYFNDNGENTYE